MKGKKKVVRNLFHDHPLLRKCDTHVKSKKAKRRSDKVKLRKEFYDINNFKEDYLYHKTYGL